MAISLTFTAPRQAALQAELTRLNAANPDATPLTLDQFVQTLVDSRADSNIRQYGTILPGEFIQRFTPAEYSAAVALGQTDKAVAGYLNELRVVPEVHVFGETVTNGLAYLVAKGVLTAPRAAAIAAIV